jgi:hypothetical protein
LRVLASDFTAFKCRKLREWLAGRQHDEMAQVLNVEVIILDIAHRNLGLFYQAR